MDRRTPSVAGVTDGKIALVTGASRGIGLATARAMATRGDSVVLVARSVEDLEREASRICDAGGAAWHWAGDVTDPRACEAMVAHATSVAGPIDICVMSAGLGHWMPVLETPEAAWRETMSLNLDAVFHTTRAALPGMIERGRGHLVYLSSVLGRKGVPNMAAYSASKAAVAAFGESVAAEVKPAGIKVTVIYPGTASTGMRDHQSQRPQTPDITDPELQLSPEDIADAIVWATGVSERAYPTAVTIEPRGLAGRA